MPQAASSREIRRKAPRSASCGARFDPRASATSRGTASASSRRQRGARGSRRRGDPRAGRRGRRLLGSDATRRGRGTGLELLELGEQLLALGARWRADALLASRAAARARDVRLSTPRPEPRSRRTPEGGGGGAGSNPPRGRRRAPARAGLAPRCGVRVEQPLDPVEPAAATRASASRRSSSSSGARASRLRIARSLIAGTARAAARRSSPGSGRGRRRSARSPRRGGSSRSLSSASAASSPRRCARWIRYTRRSASNGRMWRSRRSARIASIRIISPSARARRGRGCVRRSSEQLARDAPLSARCRPRAARGRGTRGAGPSTSAGEQALGLACSRAVSCQVRHDLLCISAGALRGVERRARSGNMATISCSRRRSRRLNASSSLSIRSGSPVIRARDAAASSSTRTSARGAAPVAPCSARTPLDAEPAREPAGRRRGSR